MNSLSVIIPSKLKSNLLPCVRAVQEHEPTAEIIVIDDGLGEAWVREANFVGKILPGKKPFGFPRNCNLGIQDCQGDVILLNDDAILKTPYGFSLLQSEAEEHPEFGLIASTTNVAGNPHMTPRGIGLRTTDRALAFVCVLIPRRTINKVGVMDERFGGLTPDGRVIYGWCDTDYTRRVRMTGLQIGIHDGCYVDHGSLISTFRGVPTAGGDITVAREIYMAKWGDLNG